MSTRSYLSIRSGATVAEKRAIRERWRQERVAREATIRAVRREAAQPARVLSTPEKLELESTLAGQGLFGKARSLLGRMFGAGR